MRCRGLHRNSANGNRVVHMISSSEQRVQLSGVSVSCSLDLSFRHQLLLRGVCSLALEDDSIYPPTEADEAWPVPSLHKDTLDVVEVGFQMKVVFILELCVEGRRSAVIEANLSIVQRLRQRECIQ